MPGPELCHRPDQRGQDCHGPFEFFRFRWNECNVGFSKIPIGNWFASPRLPLQVTSGQVTIGMLDQWNNGVSLPVLLWCLPVWSFHLRFLINSPTAPTPSLSTSRMVSDPMTAMSAFPFKKSISPRSFTPKPRASGSSVAFRHRAR